MLNKCEVLTPEEEKKIEALYIVSQLKYVHKLSQGEVLRKLHEQSRERDGNNVDKWEMLLFFLEGKGVQVIDVAKQVEYGHELSQGEVFRNFHEQRRIQCNIVDSTSMGSFVIWERMI